MSITTIGELISRLEDFDPDTKIMIAHQPSWPLAEQIAGVAEREYGDESCPEHPDFQIGHPDCGYTADVDEDADEDDKTVWLVAGGHAYGRSPYAPAWAFEGADR